MNSARVDLCPGHEHHNGPSLDTGGESASEDSPAFLIVIDLTDLVPEVFWWTTSIPDSRRFGASLRSALLTAHADLGQDRCRWVSSSDIRKFYMPIGKRINQTLRSFQLAGHRTSSVAMPLVQPQAHRSADGFLYSLF